jgi:hypothetical protein
LIEQLRQRPELMARVQTIMQIASDKQGALQKADQVEEALVQEIRQLGNATMRHWAASAQETMHQNLQQQDSTLRRGKKKILKWWTVFGLAEVQEQIWANATKTYLRPLPERLGVSPLGKSARLQRVLTDFGVEHSFARAAQSVQEHYGFEIGSTAVGTPQERLRFPGARPRLFSMSACR